MYGNFSELNRQQGGQRLAVKGWVVWEPGDTGATLTITITQGSTTAVSQPVNITPGNTPEKWEVPVNANGSPFVQGPAAGLAGATVQNGGQSSDQSWNSGPLVVH